MLYRLQPILILGARTALGVALAIALSVVGIGVAWGLFVFSGARSFVTLFSLLMIGAGFGAGLGGFLAWLNIDRNTRTNLAVMAAVALLAGVGGAWAGYQIGSQQEVACCAKPDVTPMA